MANKIYNFELFLPKKENPKKVLQKRFITNFLLFNLVTFFSLFFKIVLLAFIKQ
jgi:hypothetical protein